MHESPRCGAHSRRTGQPCRSPAVRGKKRCRMHGGAFRSGARKGNKNALKSGDFTREAIAEWREVGRMISAIDSGLGDFEDLLKE